MRIIFNSIKSMAHIFAHTFRKRETVLYPEERPEISPRWRGRIILSRDPDGEVLTGFFDDGACERVAFECRLDGGAL